MKIKTTQNTKQNKIIKKQKTKQNKITNVRWKKFIHNPIYELLEISIVCLSTRTRYATILLHNRRKSRQSKSSQPRSVRRRVEQWGLCWHPRRWLQLPKAEYTKYNIPRERKNTLRSSEQQWKTQNSPTIESQQRTQRSPDNRKPAKKATLSVTHDTLSITWIKKKSGGKETSRWKRSPGQ